MEESLKLAKRLANRFTTSVSRVKRTVRLGVGLSASRGMWIEKKLFIDCNFSGSAKREGEWNRNI